MYAPHNMYMSISATVYVFYQQKHRNTVWNLWTSVTADGGLCVTQKEALSSNYNIIAASILARAAALGTSRLGPEKIQCVFGGGAMAVNRQLGSR